jgi:hypothetical protein
MRNAIPSTKTIFENVVEVIFGCCREKITKLEMVERTSMFEICIAKFIEIMDPGRIMCLDLVYTDERDIQDSLKQVEAVA